MALNHKKKGPGAKRREIGQAISEYAMVIAFIAIMIAMVMAFTPGKIGAAISEIYFEMTTELLDLSGKAGASSSS
ncbi:MAG: hypothetical protein K2Z81_09260 [Cyanobacteria bacterium]|nr:hypothetical protein [Cyanobacteriota bacterium]